MNPYVPPEEQRDRQLRRTRRLRAGIVSAGVVGSLGVAAAVAVPTIQAANQAAPGSGSTEGHSFSLWQDGTSASNGGSTAQSQVRGDDEGEGDDGASQQNQQNQLNQQQVPVPSLQQGFGPSQGTTSGS